MKRHESYNTSVSNQILEWLQSKDSSWEQDTENPYILRDHKMSLIHIHPNRNEIKYWDDFIRAPHLVNKVTLPKHKEQMFSLLWPLTYPKQLKIV